MNNRKKSADDLIRSSMQSYQSRQANKGNSNSNNYNKRTISNEKVRDSDSIISSAMKDVQSSSTNSRETSPTKVSLAQIVKKSDSSPERSAQSGSLYQNRSSKNNKTTSPKRFSIPESKEKGKDSKIGSEGYSQDKKKYKINNSEKSITKKNSIPTPDSHFYSSNDNSKRKRNKSKHSINKNKRTILKNSDNKDLASPTIEKTPNSKSINAEGTVSPKSDNKSVKKEKRGFLANTSLFLLPITLASVAIVASFSYGVYKDSSVNKLENRAYTEGAQDAVGTPDVKSVVKIPESEIQRIVTSSPGASFPSNPQLSNFAIKGWNEPGGTIKEGKASITMCYTGDGIKTPLKATAFLVSDDATIPNPVWGVDSVSVTGDKCSANKQNNK